MYYVKSDKKIIDQIEGLCRHYKYSKDVFACMKEIAHNAFVKGFQSAIKSEFTKLPKNINNL